MTRIAIIGGGPTAIYSLRHLLASPVPLEVTLFEREPFAGPGMPYRDGMNDPAMLANIASRELPAVTRSLVAYLGSCDRAQLEEMGVSADGIDDDRFYPRLVLGAYFTAELAEVVARARGLGHRIAVRTKVRVTDIRPEKMGPVLVWDGIDGRGEAPFDHVMIATGHDWSDAADNAESGALSPWPARRIRALSGKVGILGSSLSAIDVAVAVASAHGTFRARGRALAYEPRSGTADFHLTMMSRKGLLPEADWYFPLPLPELPTFNRQNVAGLAAADDGFLERAFAMLADDLRTLDPDYADRVDLSSPEAMVDSHFAERSASDPWEYARRDLKTAEDGRRRKKATAWRVALLAAHEVFETLTPLFDEGELGRFHRTLKPIFTDGYASVPHRSIRRLLALREAGRLDLVKLPESPGMERAGQGVAVRAGDLRLSFDHVVDARGQRPRRLEDLGFASLARAVRPGWERSGYRLTVEGMSSGSIQCLAIPVLLRRRPFVQGLVNADRMGEEAAAAILSGLDPAAGDRTLAAARAEAALTF